MKSAVLAMASMAAKRAVGDGHHGESAFEAFSDVHVMPIARSDMTATAVPSTIFSDNYGPRVFLVGGCTSDQLCPADADYCYCQAVTSECDYYVSGGDYYKGCADAPNARYRHSAVHVQNKLVLLGGRDAEDNTVTAVDVFDLETGEWSTPCSWSDAPSDAGAFVENDQVFVVGGYAADYTTLSSLVTLNITTCATESRAPMPAGTRGDVQVLSHSEEHYVAGGFGNDDWCNALATVESYNVATDVWTSHPDMAKARSDSAMGALMGELFVIGGETLVNCSRSIPVDDVERLYVDNNNQGVWKEEESIPADRFRFVAASVNNAIYLFGGQGEFDPSIPGYPVHDTTMLYVPRTIRELRALESGLTGAESVAIGFIVFVVVAGLVVLGCLIYAAKKFKGYKKLVAEPSGPASASLTTTTGPDRA